MTKICEIFFLSFFFLLLSCFNRKANFTKIFFYFFQWDSTFVQLAI